MTGTVDVGSACRNALRETQLPVAEVFGPTFQGEGPYTGRICSFVRLGHCNLKCSWCFAPDTKVLMADWTEIPINDVQVGDYVWSYRKRRYEITKVERVIKRDLADRVTVLYGDREVTCTPDHVFATPHQLDGRRRSKASELAGRHVRVSKLDGWLPDEAVRNGEWWTGWLQGVVLGDGHVGQSEASPYPKVWLRVCDKELAQAFSDEVNRRGANTTVREQKRRTKRGRVVYSVACLVSKVPEVVGLPDTLDAIAGFLAGFYDAEGSSSRNQADLSQSDDKTLDRVAKMCASLGIPTNVEYCRPGRETGRVVINGLENIDRFFRITRPVLTRKTHKHRSPERMLRAIAVEDVKEAAPGPVVNLSTSTGYFFANGALVEQCDTSFTWDRSRFDVDAECPEQSVTAVCDQIAGRNTPLTVVTGGEPLLHQGREAFGELLNRLVRLGGIHVETNGTIPPTEHTRERVEHFNVSPKLSNNGADPRGKRIKPHALAAFGELAVAGRAVFKFVVSDIGDLAEVDHLVGEYQLPSSAVWIMPEGRTADQVLSAQSALAHAVLQRGWNLTTRLHVLIWGDRRGV